MHDIHAFRQIVAVIFLQNGRHFLANHADQRCLIIIEQSDQADGQVFQAKNHAGFNAEWAMIVDKQFHACSGCQVLTAIVITAY
ncbi:hypothetical protein D3C87_2058730 [compost metagenome]